MKRTRNGTAGVTLIEMLLALAVTGMIGIAGLVLLDGVIRTDAGVAGRLDRIAYQDRAFRLFALDVEHAIHARIRDQNAIELQHLDQRVTWTATEAGLKRQVTVPVETTVTQNVLAQRATFETDQPGAVTLRLIDDDVWRLVLLPTGSR